MDLKIYSDVIGVEPTQTEFKRKDGKFVTLPAIKTSSVKLVDVEELLEELGKLKSPQMFNDFLMQLKEEVKKIDDDACLGILEEVDGSKN